MGRLNKNLAEYRKEMARMEARSGKRTGSFPQAEEEQPSKAEDVSTEFKNKLPLWLQKILPILTFLLLLLFYFFSMINKQ